MTRQPWYLLQSGPGDAAFNMALDEALLHAAPRLGQPVLRFYAWSEPAASFGYFQKHTLIERLTPLRPLVRRPTGGGLVPHDADWTYSLIFPPVHDWYGLSATESYRRVHEWIRTAFTRLDLATELAPVCSKSLPGQCFQGHERFDLLCGGRKLAGAAQRRTRDGLLIQGSVQPRGFCFARSDWERAMCEAVRSAPGVQWEPYTPDARLAECTLALARQKYSQASFNRKR
ncbi:MAG TPA: lipoate--protein ligase family protein [Candidatus Paceibacterota bacterium]|nr:lipoate--protein ligase family protein [Verrucomicrobiota bacterium]HSA11725.1 lipoate--protein ligase family protein [Candidatus Paceibacterota bacterium]